MAFRVIPYSIAFKNSLFSQVKNERERGFLKKLINDHKSHSTVIHLLISEETHQILGIVGLSCSKVDQLPAVLIDYIWVNPNFRGIEIEALGTHISVYLMAYVISSIIPKIRHFASVRWLVLIPDNERLENYYIQKFGFKVYTDKHKNYLLCLSIP